MIVFLVSLFISYLVMSIAEYVIHRYMMHRRFFKSKALSWIFENHHISHHKHEDYTHNIDLPLYYHLLIGFPVFLILALYSWPAFLAFLIVCVYHSLSWTHCHRAIHGLEHNWLEKTHYYQRRKIHHELHHQNPSKNFAVIFLGTDRIFGTKI